MKRFLSFVTAAAVCTPAIAFALTIQPGDFYNDVRSTDEEAVAINVLTREGILQGYGSRRFGPTRLINRAEFLKLAMLSFDAETDPAANCFPDVRIGDWFSPYVCAAKNRGIVKGINDGRFHPANPVTYGEALKMMTLLYGYHVTPVNAAHWAEPYYRAAAARGVDLQLTIDLDRPLTRSLAARLVAAFLSDENGQLDQFRRAEAGMYPSSSSSSSSSRSSSSSSRSSSSSSSSSSNSTSSMGTIRSQFLLLGETGPVIGAAKVFIEEEPIDVTAISINVVTEASTLQGFLVYDQNNRYLGKANLDPSAGNGKKYKLTLATGTLTTAERRSEFTVYVRPVLSTRENGGVTNQLIQISNFVIEANGVWSNSKYTKASTDTYLQFLTTRAVITSVRNAIEINGNLVTGAGQRIGAFRFEGRKTDSLAQLNVSDLTFNIEQTGGVSLANVRLGADNTSDRMSCINNSTTVTCSGIPPTFGALTDGPRTITLYADITTTDPQHASLRLTLNEAGSPSTAGSIAWNDGITTFTWVPVDSPVAMGTYYKY